MNTKALLVLFLSIGWIWFCQHWHCCWIHQYCSVAEAPPPTVVVPQQDPLTFDWSSEEPITSTSYRSYEDELFSELDDDNILEITGHYFADEIAPEGYDNMGMARAKALRDLFADRIPAERVRLKSELVGETEGVRNNSFMSASFNWLVATVDKPEVVELADKTIILFPFNSASKKTDPAVDEYLDELAEELKTSDKVVQLTGHTDAIGTALYNKKLGMKRARKIRRLLINKGVKRKQIKLDSKGMAEPVASNNTEEGRSQNRRVEVRIN